MHRVKKLMIIITNNMEVYTVYETTYIIMCDKDFAHAVSIHFSSPFNST